MKDEKAARNLIKKLDKLLRGRMAPIYKRYGVSMQGVLTPLMWKPLVLVIGNYSSGKSTFINELLDMPVQRTSAGASGYPNGPIQKLERGLGNLGFGWTEIPKRIVDKTKETNPIKGLLLGAWQGGCRAFARTVSGAGDIATFPIGTYDDPAVIPDMPAAE